MEQKELRTTVTYSIAEKLMEVDLCSKNWIYVPGTNGIESGL